MKSNQSNNSETPIVSVGIVTADKVTVGLINGGKRTATLQFTAADPSQWLPTADAYEIEDVVIGIGFHWQRAETQRFSGRMEIRNIGNAIIVINHVDVETYLKSVISSEMSANASLSLLKAHAVISRSWVMTQCRKKRDNAPERQGATNEDDEIVRWYDHEDHTEFDVCADDHCQRYQGITRQTNPNVERAIDLTRGQVLMSDGEICDARFSKCCGGVTETFENCWEPRHYSYLEPRADRPDDLDVPDLTDEAVAAKWIETMPDAFCNTSAPEILSQVLNNYDRETADFYRWEAKYTCKELSELVKRKSGIDFGEIRALRPLQRGASGRIVRLLIEGSKRKLTVGKELEIRRWLSPTHLYSSAFTVHADDDGFTLRGAGWGHGVGLCQIGAAVMGAQGYDYQQILSHYYPGSEIVKLYE